MIEIILNGYTIRFKCTEEHSNALKEGKIILTEEKTIIPKDKFLEIDEEDKEEIDEEDKEGIGFHCLEEKQIVIRCAKVCKWQKHHNIGIPTEKWVDPTDGKIYNIYNLSNRPDFWIPKLIKQLDTRLVIYSDAYPDKRELMWYIVPIKHGFRNVLGEPISISPSLLHALLEAVEKTLRGKI
jgi:hypothetical protein